jgi:hypothetical protein
LEKIEKIEKSKGKSSQRRNQQNVAIALNRESGRNQIRMNPLGKKYREKEKKVKGIAMEILPHRQYIPLQHCFLFF